MPNIKLFPGLLEKIPWLDLPNIAIADPTSPTRTVQVRVAGSPLHEFYVGNRKTPIWQAWVHLAGTVPPINNAKFVYTDHPGCDFGDLKRPVAIFRGVKRPWLDEEDGRSVLAYVLNPTHTMFNELNMVCVAQGAKAPEDTVLVVLVRPYDAACKAPESGLFGAITKWEFVPSDCDIPSLPEDYGERYAEELWRRENGR
jgi:hypothetical protein